MSEIDSDIIEDEVDSIYSNKFKDNKKFNDFLGYLSDKDVCLATVKCKLYDFDKSVLLSLRAAENKPSDPFESLKDYFGAFNDHKMVQVSELREKITTIETQNQYLQEEIDELRENIQLAKEQAEAQRLADEKAKEEEALKGKKGGAARRR